MKQLLKITSLLMLVVLVASCDKTEDPGTDEDPGTETMDKPGITTFMFASTNTECGAYTQDRNGMMIHINTEKCNNEIYRPTLTLYFGMGDGIEAGTYNVVENQAPGAGEVYITASDYMNPVTYPQIVWVATAGSIEIVANETDAGTLDVELQSITMLNTSFEVTTDIPETDVLTGYIIGV